MALSKKRQTQLYRIISDEIMDARISINKLLVGNDNDEKIDLILYELGMSAPRKAIDLFKPKEQ